MTRPERAVFAIAEPELALTPGTWLLEASAGTGKTYTIVGLIVRLILDRGLAIERCAVMTFTRAATAELRDRLRARLGTVLDCLQGDEAATDGDPLLGYVRSRWHGDPTAIRRIRQAQAELDGALIATIHGVCHRLLADHALAAGVALDAEIDGQLERWRGDTIGDLLRDWMRRISEDGARLLRGSLDSRRLEELARSIEQHPILDFVGVAAAGPEEIDARIGAVRDGWDDWAVQLADDFAGIEPPLPSAYKGGNLKRKLTAISKRLAGIAEFKDLVKACNQLLIPDGRAELRDRFAERDWHRGLTALRDCAAAAERQVMQDYREALRRRPQQTTHLHYNDLLSALNTALDEPASRTALRQSIGSRYDAILVDEFQDTDLLQWRILDELFTEAHQHLYLIGDPKQAIYAFRGADVHAYLQAADMVPAERQATLHTNYRSDAQLVTAVNALFDRGPQSFAEAGIDFAAVEAVHERRLALPAAFPAAPLQCWWQEPDASIARTREAIARRCADEALALVSTGAQQPRDLAMLVRNHSEGELLATALRERGLASVRNLRSSVFAGHCASEVERVLDAVLQPQRERCLRSAALTSLGGVSPAELVAGGDTLPDLALRLRELRELWQSRGFAVFWQDLLDQGIAKGPVRTLLAQDRDGERELTDLLHLGDLLSATSRDQALGPEALLRWFQGLVVDPTFASEEQLLRLDRDDDAVRIMTIHASKGLEFPIVFVPFCWSSGRSRATGLHHVGHQSRWHWGPELPEEVHQQQRQSELAEDLRLLYVAVTRARHRCYLAYAPQAAVGASPGCTASALSWLLAGLGRCQAHELAAFMRQQLGDETSVAELRDRFASEQAALDTTDPVERCTTPRWSPERPRPATDQIQLHEWSSPARRRWVSSYSGLIRNRPVEEPDYDQLAGKDDAGTTEADSLPRGAQFGSALHAVFEHCPFDADQATTLAACEQQLLAHGLAAEHAPALAELVRRTCRTKVPGTDGALETVAAQRLAELEVLLPVVGSATIAAVFRDHGDIWSDYGQTIADLSIPPGFFTGFIDLIFQHDGRFHLLDWKSNDLSRKGGYGQAAMQLEMRHHHYALQYHLYLVALQRHLRLRLQDYDYERHIGSVHYVFARGIDDEDKGWFSHRPSQAMIDGLDACFGAVHA